MKYYVTFVRYNEYEVEAESDAQAVAIAEKKFLNDRLNSSVCDTHYDDIRISCPDEYEENDDDEEE